MKRYPAYQITRDSQFDLAEYYRLGIGVPTCPTEAFYWYSICAVNKKIRCHRRVDAQCMVGICFFTGIGVEQDFQEATYWYKIAAKNEHAKSQYLLSRCYRQGYGVNISEKLADYWLAKAEENGYHEQSNNNDCI